MTELAQLVKTDPVLNRKWNLYLGLDMYMPTLMVWLLMRERSRPDIKKRLTKATGFTTLPYPVILQTNVSGNKIEV